MQAPVNNPISRISIGEKGKEKEMTHTHTHFPVLANEVFDCPDTQMLVPLGSCYMSSPL